MGGRSIRAGQETAKVHRGAVELRAYDLSLMRPLACAARPDIVPFRAEHSSVFYRSSLKSISKLHISRFNRLPTEFSKLKALRATLNSTMVFVLDNYDSFTYNLVQYLGELGAEVEVRRNDEVTVEEVEALKPERILLSPGPCTPGEAGILVPLIRHMAKSPRRLPILGVCLGHQAIGEAFGGKVVRAHHLMHGKTSPVEHDGKGIFAGLPTPLTCTRYHSLIVAEESLPEELTITARTPEANGAGKAGGSVIMGLRHRTLPIEGVQFHPESVLTEGGKQMIRNFLDL
jgi:anthranilate synthase/aminodeoxychorismate synthase-like glutamine amidotransferase